MSNNQEYFFKNSIIGSIDFLELQSGVRNKTIAITQSPPFGPSSQVLGFKRTVSGGTLGTPFLAGVEIVSGNTTATIKSTSATDTSFYIMYYVNPEPQPNIKSSLNLI